MVEIHINNKKINKITCITHNQKLGMYRNDHHELRNIYTNYNILERKKHPHSS